MNRRAARTFLVLAAVAALAIIVRAAWLCDDSYITIRTVDNFVAGYGLRWNVDERVQAFTHPLWLWTLVPGYWLSGSARITLLGTSFLAAACALALVVRTGWQRPGITAAVLLALAGSKSFVEYSTSGLEEPLLFCLLAAMHVVTLRKAPSYAGTIFVAGLIFLTRMDAVLLVVPFAAVTALGERRRFAPAAWVATLPVVAWLAFATFYYGVPFPNTAYAKLGHGVPRLDLIAQGGRYVADFFVMDPVGSALVLCGLAFATVRRQWAISAGILLWTAYVVWIGGDFMSGRMLAPAVWMAAILIVRYTPDVPEQIAILVGVAIASLALLSPSPAIYGRPVRSTDGRTAWRVTDERQFYYPTTGLLLHGATETAFDHPWPRRVLAARDRGERVLPFKWVGFAGYFAGPTVHLIDEYGLTDPLLARLPALPDWAPGHFLRQVPDGYVETIATGRNRIANQEIGRYYERLELVTRGPLFGPGRLQSILVLNVWHPRVSPTIR